MLNWPAGIPIAELGAAKARERHSAPARVYDTVDAVAYSKGAPSYQRSMIGSAMAASAGGGAAHKGGSHIAHAP